MKWFEGSIGEAVAATRSKKAIFVVFIEGKDDESVQVAQAIDESEVSSRLDRENFVAIKLESGSDSYRFFAEMYQLVPVPSIFFIDNGIPMEIVAGKTTASELAVKIDGLLKKVKSNSSLDLISAEQKVASASSSGSGASSSKIVDKVPERVTPTLNKDHKTEEPMTVEMAMDNASLPSDTEQKMETEEQNSGIQDNQIHLTAEEKLERARKLIELQKKQRQEEEDRKQRERELERRKVGRDVQKMRQKQQDLEMKLALEERAKEKAAEAAARDRVRQQIAQDKLERKEREMKLQQTQQQQQQQQSTSQQEAPKAVVSNASVTRIQFRLPSGDPHMGQFEPTSTLGALRNYVAENVNLPFRHFSMSTSFPRRELNTEEDDKTLLELELVPTAVILILPMRSPNATSVTSTQDVGFLSKLMWTIFAPIIGVFNLVMGYFSGGRQTTRSETPQNDASTNSVPRTDNNVASTTSAASSHFSNAPYASGLIRRNVNSQGGSTIRTQGNIHRLHSGGEDNDENNTWNGNSTQQM